MEALLDVKFLRLLTIFGGLVAGAATIWAVARLLSPIAQGVPKAASALWHALKVVLAPVGAILGTVTDILRLPGRMLTGVEESGHFLPRWDSSDPMERKVRAFMTVTAHLSLMGVLVFAAIKAILVHI